VGRFGGSARARAALAILLSLLLPLGGCGFLSDNFLGASGQSATIGTEGYVSGFLGGVAADEPRAVLAGREILSAGGTAADAAVAVALTLAVTLPSRASLGGGGACLAYDPKLVGPGGGAPEAILFPPVVPAHPGVGDRPAAIPMLPRGLFLLHAKYGSLPFERLMANAEELARFGVPASRALAQDVALVAAPLAGDPVARDLFLPGGQPIAEGVRLVQPALAATLGEMRTGGVGDFYQGSLAQSFAAAATTAGGGLSTTDLYIALPRAVPAPTLQAGNDRVAFLPAPEPGGPATQGAFAVLQANPGGYAQAQQTALQYAASTLGSVPQAFPASTSFVTLDHFGHAVACALTMNNLFGTGRVAPGTGVVLAAAQPPALLAVALAYNVNIHRFRAATAASGQEAAPVAAALAMVEALGDRGDLAQPLPVPPPEPGRANVVQCDRYLPGAPGSCGWATDPRGAGLALGSS
jgi:gamma-glutamyltranspeptidase/glutathione hydrolase